MNNSRSNDSWRAALEAVSPEDLASAWELTAREGEIALELLWGRSQAVVAEKLAIAKSTVQVHFASVKRKARVENVLQLTHRLSEFLRNRGQR